MELDRLLNRIRQRWRDDRDSEFYGMRNSQIDSILKRKSRTWDEASRRSFAHDEEKGVGFPLKKLEERYKIIKQLRGRNPKAARYIV